MSEEIRPGRYRHFKGKEYEVLGVARHSETEEEYVVYRQLYGEHSLWVRPASMWNEMVTRDGQDPATVHLCGRGSLMCGQRNCKISVSHKN